MLKYSDFCYAERVAAPEVTDKRGPFSRAGALRGVRGGVMGGRVVALRSNPSLSGGVATHSAWQPSLRELLRNAATGAWPYILYSFRKREELCALS